MPAPALDRVPAAPGTYVLLLAVDRRRRLQIGRRGRVDLPAGVYAYVGSARGPGGLRARVGRHLDASRPVHWHIDYLKRAARAVAVLYAVGTGCREHAWAGVLRGLPGATVPLDRFGASDCGCHAHLFGFGARPRLQAIALALLDRDGAPAGERVERLPLT